MDEADEENTPTTRLLTLLNVSALKRKRPLDSDSPVPEISRQKLNKRKAVGFAANLESGPSKVVDSGDVEDGSKNENQDTEEDLGANAGGEANDATVALESYESHFGPEPNILTESSRNVADKRQWKSARVQISKFSAITSMLPTDSNSLDAKLSKKSAILERLRTPFEVRQAKQPDEQIQVQNDLLSILSSHLDLYHTALSLDHHRSTREAVTLHALDHVTKKRRRVLKNNERLAHAKSASQAPPADVLDQGFTRPAILILIPFRSSALAWVNALTTHTPSPTYQVENHSRFAAEYGLPPGAVDKLAEAEPGTHPRDHIETFKGNVDDNFRLGVKLTRKSVKLFAEFYGCDIILASPLGLRMSIEKEKNADFLSSIEILIVDQMDALAMQNWDHVQFVLSNMNKLPKESHDADFSRIKPWYLDGHSAYLRQSILLSAFKTPEMRSLYNQSLKNVAGKVRIDKSWPAIQVPASIDQLFVSFDCVSLKEEPEKRFNYFTTQLLPKILKSAVRSSNTVIFVPSSLDFIRVHNYFRKQTSVSFAVLSEYSTNQDISRARQAFFTSKKSFLLISERFHFYRRYKIRGIRNIIFYGPPDHPQFFSEFLSYPFLDDGVEGDDVCCRVLWCKYDRFRLERIVGTKGIRAFLEGGSAV
ncbi:digestive organ expansion factor [Hygrophoropsis aurantiaca]|uniref:Digestive organ expansion factor n=1 Tax=Hygrophoropsis aurantiaca TaxID=72124 RepID=A0ACB8AIR8_9AGAM|nr:digestive organ expansion factor [Hygrophoropsis aurantiaca]